MYGRRLTAAMATALALSLIAVAIVAICEADEAVAPFHITSHDPPVHEVGVALNANVHATFDEDVNASTVTSNTFVVYGNLGGLASGSFGYDGGTRTLTLDPDRAFHAGEVLRVSATSGISSTGAAPLTPYGWQFTAGPVRDRRFAGFTEIDAGVSGYSRLSVAWGDYDNDGDLDILLGSRVYRNNGDDSFTDIGAGLVGGSGAWGDYDNDGDLDILLDSRVYRNNGDDSFTDVGAGLWGVAGAVAWGDYDNDGDLDILLTGSVWAGIVSLVYRNDGGGAFTDIGAGLLGLARGSCAWGDYDNDGDLDILVTGVFETYPHQASKVYRNDGGGAFTDIGAGVASVREGSVAWGDYDNDGDLDILFAGQGIVNLPASSVYRNDGGGAFTKIRAGLTGGGWGSAAWGDYDNDGDLDILLTGSDRYDTLLSRVYRNDGGGAFRHIGAGLTAVWRGSSVWGDYDSDGDLDILLTGSDSSGHAVCKLYRNNSAPQLGSVMPSSGSGPVGATTYFTTTWTDPDGWENLKRCYFGIGASASVMDNVALLYNAMRNKLWLRSDDGSTWLGGFAPESANVLENSQARVHCDLTTAQGAGDTLSVIWAIEFKPGFEGTKKLGLKCKDIDQARAKGQWKGTWTIE
jgi:hypothetical protein